MLVWRRGFTPSPPVAETYLRNSFCDLNSTPCRFGRPQLLSESSLVAVICAHSVHGRASCEGVAAPFLLSYRIAERFCRDTDPIL